MKLYLPVLHHSMDDNWRVHVYKENQIYTIRLREDFTRVFTDQSLPDYVRLKLIMADATYEPVEVWQYPYQIADIFIYRGSFEDMISIGWRVDENNYVAVLPQENIDSLNGEQIKYEKTKELKWLPPKRKLKTKLKRY